VLIFLSPHRSNMHGALEQSKYRHADSIPKHRQNAAADGAARKVLITVGSLEQAPENEEGLRDYRWSCVEAV
jgi:hypothetical protein